MNRVCSVLGCDQLYSMKGFCWRHYQRNRKHNAPTSGRISPGKKEEWLRSLAQDGAEGCIEWPFKSRHKEGYGLFGSCGKNVYAHRFVCEMTHGPAPVDRPYAAHRCGNAACCSPKHLRWANASENNLDRRGHGTAPIGERNHMAKLTEDQVRRMRAAYGTLNVSEISRLYDVSWMTAKAAISGKNWRHLIQLSDIQSETAP